MSTPTLSPLRVDRITGSRLPAILGLSPYTTRRGVMREMVRQHFEDSDEFVDNPVTRWGQEHEADALAAYAEQQEAELFGYQEFVIHPKYDFLGVSLDARTKDGVVEAKSPWRATYRHISERLDYQEQLGLQIDTVGVDYGHLAVYRPDEPIAVSTQLADPRWLADRLPKIYDFMDEYWEIIGNPELAEPHRTPLVNMRSDEEWAVAALEFLEEAGVLSRQELRVSAARQRLVDLAGTKSAKGAGVSVVRSVRKGTVDWPTVQKQYIPDIDVESFRKDSSVVFTVRPWTQEKEQQ